MSSPSVRVYLPWYLLDEGEQNMMKGRKRELGNVELGEKNEIRLWRHEKDQERMIVCLFFWHLTAHERSFPVFRNAVIWMEQILTSPEMLSRIHRIPLLMCSNDPGPTASNYGNGEWERKRRRRDTCVDRAASIIEGVPQDLCTWLQRYGCSQGGVRTPGSSQIFFVTS